MCHQLAQVVTLVQQWLPGKRCLAQHLHCDSPLAALGSSPPAGIPSASFAPRCSRDALPPTDGSQHRQEDKKIPQLSACLTV